MGGASLKLTCPNNPEHKTFTVVAFVPETWILNEDGDCEDAWADGGNIEFEFKDAKCQDCLVEDNLDVSVVLKEE